MRLKFIIEDTLPEAMTPRRRNAMVKKEMFAIGEHWHQKFRPDHFKRIAFSKYGYTQRKKSYVARKIKAGAGNLPLVLSGWSRTLSKQRRIIATPNKVHVQMPVRVFNFKPRNSSIDMRKEFSTITSDEYAEFEKMVESGLVKQITSYQGRKRWQSS